MATEKSFQLYINEDNVKQYFSASGGALNGAAIGGKYITMRTSSTTATFTMNDAGRDVLFPSAAAIAHKVDVWAQTIATLNNSKNTINVAIAGQNAIATERIRTSLTEHTGSVSGSFTKSSTSAVYVIKIVNGFHAAGVRDTSITAYFTQYFCAANKSGNGVKSVSVSNAAPYAGETVTFSAELYNGANFDGWYSDEACTQLVSSSLTYSTTAADLTLYAKATIDANLYNVSAVAGSEITSVSVSDSIVPDGDTVTFTAQVNTGCSFEGWYSNDTYTTVVSTENPYTTTITADTTLYAKAHRNSLNMSVGSAEHGTASVSATTVPYGNDVTFTFTPEDETWELYGWYSDSGFTQLVSEANPYTFIATENVTLYPKVGRVRYTITLTTSKEWYHNFQNEIISYDYALLTETEISYLKTGEFDKIDQNKIYDRSSVEGTQVTTQHTASIKCPFGYAISIYLEYNSAVVLYISRNNVNLTAWPYYTTFPTEDQEYLTVKGEPPCYCEAIIVDGILSTDATTPVSQGKEAIFTAEISPGYTFSGWYSDEACTTLVSTDNPAYVITPKYTTENRSETYLTLYAKATKATYTIGVGTVEHGTATVSANTAHYGDNVTFTFTPEDETWELYGWYSDEGLTQLVSESNPYTHSVVGNVTLYPKVGAKRYTITLKRNQYIGNGMTHHLTIASLYEDQLTDTEREYIKTGEFSKIDQAKIFDITTVDGNDMTSAITATLKAPKNLLCVLYSKISGWVSTGKYYLTGFALNKDPGLDTNVVQDKVTDPSVICPWNYYSFYPKASDTYYVVVGHVCDCFAIAKDGVAKTTVPTHVMQYTKAPFSAELSPGYTFAGWYSDEACTQLVSTDNPAQITCPAYTTENPSSTSLTLYAKATPLSSTTGIYLKRSGSWIKAKSVFKKTNGVWVEQEDLSDIFSGESSGTASNYVYGGSV